MIIKLSNTKRSLHERRTQNTIKTKILNSISYDKFPNCCTNHMSRFNVTRNLPQKPSLVCPLTPVIIITPFVF